LGKDTGKSLVKHFAIIQYPRQGIVKYDLVGILVIVTCALFSEMETFVDIAEWARYKEPWLRRFLRLEHGEPSHDTMNRVFRLIDPQSFEVAFRAWVADSLPGFAQTQIAIDSKSIRGAAAQRNPVHLLSAFATETGIVFAQQGVAGKGSGTAAIPE
jgi:hypothetical protein